jgi:hypothetical protein
MARKTHSDDPINPTSFSQSGTGLTKREYFAAMAMQVLVGYKGTYGMIPYNQTPLVLAERAVECADALIEELNKPIKATE